MPKSPPMTRVCTYTPSGYELIPRAFTLTELLVSLLILAVILALTLPSLSSARQKAVEAKCLSNMRSAGLVLTSYSNDFNGHFPYAGDHSRIDYFQPPSVRWDHPIGGRFGLRGGMWAVLFPDDWAGIQWNPALRCPRQPNYNPVAPTSSPPLDAASLAMPQYWLSSAMWLDAGTLDRLDRPYKELRTRPNAIHDVTFPSLKVVFFEQMAFCAGQRNLHQWLSIGQTPFADTTIELVDGSVSRLVRQDGLPAVGSLPFDRTLQGVRGRDLP